MSIIKGTSDNYEQEVLKSKVPVLVDFNATWCPPCQALHPTLEAMADSKDYKIVAVDVDEEPELAANNSVGSIPCLVFYRDGQEYDRRVGLQPRKRLEKILGGK